MVRATRVENIVETATVTPQMVEKTDSNAAHKSNRQKTATIVANQLTPPDPPPQKSQKQPGVLPIAMCRPCSQLPQRCHPLLPTATPPARLLLLELRNPATLNAKRGQN